MIRFRPYSVQGLAAKRYRDGSAIGFRWAFSLSRKAITPDTAASCVFFKLRSYSGIFPCFFGGRVSLLVFMTSRASISLIRVSRGLMTASM